MSTSGETTERQHRLLHRDVAALGRWVQQSLFAKLLERGAEHHARGDLRERHTGRLAHERHGTARARVRLDDEDGVVLHCVLHVAQPDHIECLRERAGVLFDRADHVRGKRRWRDRARGVTGMHTRFLDVLHHAADQDFTRTVAQRVDIDLDGVLEEAVDERRSFERQAALTPE